MAGETFRERFLTVYAGGQPARVPNCELGYFEQTWERFVREGLPAAIPMKPVETGTAEDFRWTRNSREAAEFFGLESHDYIPNLRGVSSGPVPGVKAVRRDERGEDVFEWYDDGSMIHWKAPYRGVRAMLTPPVRDRASWEATRKRFDPTAPERVPPANDPRWDAYRRRDYPLQWQFNGFFWKMREWMEVEGFCMAIHDEPALVEEMLETWCDFLEGLARRVLERVQPDMVIYREDLAGRNGPMVSPAFIRRAFGPRYRRLNDIFERAGVPVIMVDSDGLVDPVVGVLLDAGITGLTPWEIQAGTDPVAVAKRYPSLGLIGAVNKLELAKGRRAIDAELARHVAPLLERSRYLPTVDHLLHEDVSLANYQYYLERKARLLERG